jgi:hypothetical protein
MNRDDPVSVIILLRVMLQTGIIGKVSYDSVTDVILDRWFHER